MAVHVTLDLHLLDHLHGGIGEGCVDRLSCFFWNISAHHSTTRTVIVTHVIAFVISPQVG